MAKRNSKKSLKSRKKQTDHSILSKQSNESCVLLGVSSPVSSLSSIPGHSPIPNSSVISPKNNECTCKAKFPKLLSLDESTMDGSDVTWEDQSRHFCVCPKGKDSNRVREVLSTMPSVDTPSSKHKKLSLGSLMPMVDNDNITGLNLKSRGHSENALQDLLQQIKSPITNSRIHSNCTPLSSANNNNQFLNGHDSRKHARTPDDQETDTTQTNTDTANDLLPSDFDILEDLAIFSPLTDNTPCNTQQYNHHSPYNNTTVTPLRKLSSLRKRLVTDVVDNPSTDNIGTNLDKETPSGQHDDNDNDDELLFWSQVADEIVDTESTATGTENATTDTNTVTTGTITVATDPATAYDDYIPMMDDDLLLTCISIDSDDELPIVGNGEGDSNVSQPQNHIGRVYSQQDIDAKRLRAKKKLQQKFKSI